MALTWWTTRTVRELAALVGQRTPSVSQISDDELRARTRSLRFEAQSGADLTALLPDAFAIVREAAKRTLGLQHFDVQVLGGVAMHLGHIAEMSTGEGKTLAASLPVFLHALSGEGSHLATVNDYLTRRDAENSRRSIARWICLSVLSRNRRLRPNAKPHTAVTSLMAQRENLRSITCGTG